MPTTLELLWGSADRPRRGPKPSLTLERIVTEAIDLADTEGLGNLSMARLAERLGCAKMALYRYVPGKAELTALMLDAALGAPPDNEAALAAAEPWRVYLRPWVQTFFDRVRAHPWANEIAVGIRPMGPNELAWLDSALATMTETGLTAAERFDTIALLLGHARGIAQQTASVPGQEDFEGGIARELGQVMAAQATRFPHAVGAFADTMGGSVEETGRDNALGFGIDRILDGLAVYMSTRKG